MARLASALNDLVAFGFDVLARPHDLSAASRVPLQAAIVAQLGEQYRTQGQFLRGAETLVAALDQLVFFRRVDPDLAPAWEAIVGAAIAVTRAQAWKSIAWEQEHLT